MHLPSSSTLIFLSTLPLLTAALPASNGIHGRNPAHNGKAIYLITNGVENSVAALPISADGTLGDAKLTPTGGKGGATVNAMGQPAAPDSLVSQSALTIAGKHIFAVNAGSNTISMFAIDSKDPTWLKMVGEPAALPGTFPNTVAASAKNSLVCVGTTGSKAGISCANFDAKHGIGAMDALRPFPLGQSDPPSGPVNTVSHTFFSADQLTLFTTVKGNPMVNNTGFLSAFSVDRGETADCAVTLSTKETRSKPNGTAVLFGSQPIPDTNPPQIFSTDASFGAAILSVSPSSTATTLALGPIADQMATCWVAISPVTKTAYVTDVAINRIVEMSLKDASITGEIDLRMQTKSPGFIDLRAAGGYLYALAPGNATVKAAVSVVDLASKALVQQKELAPFGIAATAMGMAVLM
ncbi:hypothetical protein BDV95DRAFT_501291 [Massariosphaeria phaeospora]|uniref:Lactonase, 7-bladed beta-propeller-domain-containing protein n=1 Tax=Massariosphaeria phaeospora TaxID=100035 RepID=A0A7C8M2N3_9PLEO|nr:hypothetical protein BDV95DRAFT_501291 [Massariosphaeria phaeospora]